MSGLVEKLFFRYPTASGWLEGLCLHEPAMRLGFDFRQFYLLWRNAQVEPGRHLGDRQFRVAAEHHLGDHLLGPARPGLAIG